MAAPSRLLFFVFLSGCASSVWNRRTLDCGEVDTVISRSEFWYLALQVRPDDDADSCSAIARGLHRAVDFEVDDGTLTLENVPVVEVLHPVPAAGVGAAAIQWGRCDPSNPTCGDGPGALIEIGRLERAGRSVRGLRVQSDGSGAVRVDSERASFSCSDCSFRGSVQHPGPVSLDIRDAGVLVGSSAPELDRTVRLCASDTDTLLVRLRGNVPTAVIELTTPAASVQIETLDGAEPEVTLILPSAEHPYTLDGPGTVDLLVSNGSCEPLEFHWDD